MVGDAGDLEEELRQFTGTQQYYMNFTGLLFTDGIKYLADRASCYWLIDLVGSYQPQLRHIPFQLWEIGVRDDSSALGKHDEAYVLTGAHQTGGSLLLGRPVSSRFR